MRAHSRHGEAAIPTFPGNPVALTSRTRKSSLSVSRSVIDVEQGGLFECTMPVEDAFVVLFQLRDHPPHEFRLGGKIQQVPAVAKSTLNIIDLKRNAFALLRDPVDTLFFHIPRTALDEIAEDSSSMRIATLAAPEPWNTSDPVVEQLQPLFVEALANSEPANSLLHDNLLMGLAGHFATTYGGMRSRTCPVRGGLAPWQERRAKELLSTNLADELPLQDVARECNLSVGYFARAFKKTAGTSPHAWRQTRRIDRAKELLMVSPASLAELAATCGFADQSHFHRVFVQCTGITPGAWRRTLKEF